MIDEIKVDAQERMAKSIDSLKNSLNKVRTGRAHASLLDNIVVEYYGMDTPLSQVGNISVPDARERNAEATFQFNCETAWSPPIKVWEKLHDMGIIIDASYQDEGMMYEGTFIDGVDKTWTPEEEAV